MTRGGVGGTWGSDSGCGKPPGLSKWASLVPGSDAPVETVTRVPWQGQAMGAFPRTVPRPEGDRGGDGSSWDPCVLAWQAWKAGTRPLRATRGLLLGFSSLRPRQGGSRQRKDRPHWKSSLRVKGCGAEATAGASVQGAASAVTPGNREVPSDKRNLFSHLHLFQ